VKIILTKLSKASRHCRLACRNTLHPPPQSSYKKPNQICRHHHTYDTVTMSSSFKEIQIQHQKHYSNIPSFPFPSALSPNPFSSSTLSFFTDSIIAQKPFLDSLLLKTGAILFRGFDVNTAKDFNDVVEAFGFEELPYVGGAAPRTNVVGRVFTANESPPDQKIPFHHEMAQVRPKH